MHGTVQRTARLPGIVPTGRPGVERTIGVAGLDRDMTLQLEAELHQSAEMEPELYRAARHRLDWLDPWPAILGE